MYTHNKTAKNRFLNIDIVGNETREYHKTYQVRITKIKYQIENEFIITL